MVDKASAGKIMTDVARPGTSLPAATSKAVLVSNKPATADPMVSTDTAVEAPKLFTKLRIEPLPHTEPETHEADQVAATSVSTESFDEEVAGETLKAQNERVHREFINKLIDSHKYYLPINQAQRHRTKQLVWLALGIAIIIGLAWTYLLLDAGIISIPGFTVPTHFFQ